MKTPTQRPALFTGPMVRAILDGRKTQTRRVVKFGCLAHSGFESVTLEPEGGVIITKRGNRYVAKNRYGQSGDLLWVKQPWAAFDLDWRGMDDWREAPRFENRYMATNAPEGFKWRSARFMPKRAAKLWLRVTDVRVERVQEISNDDACAEGVMIQELTIDDGIGGTPHCRFTRLWDLINAKRGFGWDVNPWVFVVTFEQTDAP